MDQRGSDAVPLRELLWSHAGGDEVRQIGAAAGGEEKKKSKIEWKKISQKTGMGALACERATSAAASPRRPTLRISRYSAACSASSSSDSHSPPRRSAEDIVSFDTPLLLSLSLSPPSFPLFPSPSSSPPAQRSLLVPLSTPGAEGCRRSHFVRSAKRLC